MNDSFRDTRRAILRVFQMYMLIFFCLGLYIAYVMGVQSFTLTNDPENPRNLEILSRRGKIYTRSGTVIAYSKKVDGVFRRVYENGLMYEPMLGYVSARYGKSGLEEKLDKDLRSPREGRNLLEVLTRYRPRGEDVYLTIDEDLQREAVNQLEGVRGAIVALNPQTGEILALASSPSFDPNTLDENWEEISGGKDAQLLLRAVNGYYPPGSTFKVFTLGVAYEMGVVWPDMTFTCTGGFPISYDMGVYTVRDSGGGSHGVIDSAYALAYSCNIAFAQMGLKVGAEAMVDYAMKFGFHEKPDFPLAEESPGFPSREELSETQLAQTAFGQGRLLMSPLQVALMTGVFAAEGVMYRPQIVKARMDENGKFTYTMKPEVWKRPVSSLTTSRVSEAMVSAVERGTARSAMISGYRVAGKTGTAENASGETHAWFTCFSPDKPDVVVTVIVENAGYGGAEAAPRARGVLEVGIRKSEFGGQNSEVRSQKSKVRSQKSEV